VFVLLDLVLVLLTHRFSCFCIFALGSCVVKSSISRFFFVLLNPQFPCLCVITLGFCFVKSPVFVYSWCYTPFLCCCIRGFRVFVLLHSVCRVVKSLIFVLLHRYTPFCLVKSSVFMFLCCYIRFTVGKSSVFVFLCCYTPFVGF